MAFLKKKCHTLRMSTMALKKNGHTSRMSTMALKKRNPTLRMSTMAKPAAIADERANRTPSGSVPPFASSPKRADGRATSTIPTRVPSSAPISVDAGHFSPMVSHATVVETMGETKLRAEASPIGSRSRLSIASPIPQKPKQARKQSHRR